MTNGEPRQAVKLLLTPRQAASALSVSERSLFELTKTGEIPSIVVGKAMRRYSVAALQRWIDEQGQQPQQDDAVGSEDF